MLEVKGKYGVAKVVDVEIEQKVKTKLNLLLDSPAFSNQIIIMPDYHEGKGAVIGFTMPMTEYVVPNVIGVDIGCSMLSANLGKDPFKILTIEEADQAIRHNIPFGTDVHKSYSEASLEVYSLLFQMNRVEFLESVKKFNQKFNHYYNINMIYSLKDFEADCAKWGMDPVRVFKSVGTLGGGNHFIEFGVSQKTGDYWVTIHTGSRQLGNKIAQYWQRIAGKGELDYLEGEDVLGYLTDMQFAQNYAKINRNIILHKIAMLLFNDQRKAEDIASNSITTVHNYINFDDFIIRKGAIASYKGEQMIIPFNMEDGIIICEGKSNPEWNYSAPHGAGRLGSRTWAKENLSLTEAETRMKEKGIYTSCLPIDELKGAYKDPEVIEKAIEPTATIIDRLKPILNMKTN